MFDKGQVPEAGPTKEADKATQVYFFELKKTSSSIQHKA
jgi:hypothetical protein